MTTAIVGPFARLRTRARVGILSEALGSLAIAGGVFLVASFALDLFLRLEVGYRAALLALFALVVVRIVQVRLLRPMRTALSDDELALAVERNDPPLRQALISAVQFDRVGQDARGRESEAMRRLVVADVAARMERIPFGAALDAGRGIRYGGVAVLVAAAVVAWIAVDARTFGLWLRRNLLLSAVEWPRQTLLEFVEPVQRIPQGDDLTLRVAAQGVVPEQVRLAYAFAGGDRGRERMTLTGTNEFRTTLTSVLEPVTVWAEGGDGITQELRIEIVQRPVITGLRVSVQPPEYVGQAATESSAEGDVRILRGSRLHLSARSDKPVREAFLLLGESDRLPLVVDTDGHGLHGELVPAATGAVLVDVVDVDRLGAKAPPRLYVRVQDDQAPSIDLRLAGIGSMVTPQARIPAELTVRDDFGLVEVTAWHRVSGKPAAGQPGSANPVDGGTPEGGGEEPTAGETKPEPQPEPEFLPVAASGLTALAPGEREMLAEVAVDLRELAVAQAGQMLALRFDAKDNFGPEQPHVTQGEPVVFRVVTPEELAADLQRRQLEQRKLLEAVLSQQETARAQLDETIDPTSADERAGQARNKLLQLAKTERDLGGRCGSIAQSYTQILDEALNNRIAQAADLRGMRERVVQPLGELATVDFAQAASATEAYATAGKDDLKQVALAVYDRVIQRIRTILAHMVEEERLAAMVALLKDVIKLQDQAADEASKRRGEAGADVFGTGRNDKNK